MGVLRLSVTFSAVVDSEILHIRAHGSFNCIDDYKDFIKGCYDTIIESGLTQVLIDARDIEYILSLEIPSKLADYITKTFPSEIRGWKVAAVLPVKIGALAEFFQFISRCKGQTYRIFTSFDKAYTYIMTDS